MGNGHRISLDPDEPQRIGAYRILDVLGEGGMGTVYLAEQKEPVRRRVAVKVIKLGMDSRRVIHRFEAERQALAMMEHGSIAKVYDCGITDRGQPYFAMEYVKGVPITRYCDDHRLTLEERLELFRQVCSGVQHAHNKGVIHRDLTPRNVLVTIQDSTPTPKIIDFGLARATDHHLTQETIYTEQGEIIGTPEYMSPEQAGLGGLDIDTRTDVYTLGLLLYELLVGELPVSGSELRKAGLLEMQRRIREDDPPRPSTKLTSLGSVSTEIAYRRCSDVRGLRRQLHHDLDWVVMKALEKDRIRRYETPTELAADLRRYLRHEPVLAGPPGVGYRTRKFIRRHRIGLAATAGVFVALAAGAIGTYVQYLQAEDSRRTTTVLLDSRSAQLLVSRVDDMHPATPKMSGALQDWVEEARVRVANLPVYEVMLASDDLASQSDRARDLRTAVDNLGRLEEALPEMEVRLATATGLRQLTVEAEQDAWATAIAAIENSSIYRMRIRPQVGLIPLGVNEQGYWEFWCVLSGLRPEYDASTGRNIITEDSGIILVLLPGGDFTMGSPPDEADRFVDEEQRRVHVEPFFLGKYEVTQDQWQRLMGSNPSLYGPGFAYHAPRAEDSGVQRITCLHPVESVTWFDSRTCAVRADLRLPEEDEWEYACRAGTTTPFFWGATSDTLEGKENVFDLTHTEGRLARFVANWYDGYAMHAPVGAFCPNGFGLYDMHGNVAEWCQDWYRSSVPPDDQPRRRVFRGGHWYAPLYVCRSAFHQYAIPRALNHVIGARFARDLRE